MVWNLFTCSRESLTHINGEYEFGSGYWIRYRKVVFTSNIFSFYALLNEPQQHTNLMCRSALWAFTPICLKVHVVTKWQWISGVSLFQRWSAILFIIYSPRDYREYGPSAAGQMLRSQHLSYIRHCRTDASADFIFKSLSIEWNPLSQIITSCTSQTPAPPDQGQRETSQTCQSK